jgi:hypothetical protein
MAYDPSNVEVKHWLNRDRLNAYPRIFLILYLLAACWIFAGSHNGLTSWGKPLGSDFIAFWGASHTALHGAAADAYDVAKLALAQQVAIPASTTNYAWFYPPTFYLLILPLALLPYTASFALFTGVTLGAFLALLRPQVRQPGTLPLALAFPGVFVNLMQGQNGFLTSALAAGALALLQRRPLAAGVVIGLLAIKPHLAVLFPVALLAAGYFRAALAAAASTCIFAAASVAVVSPEAAHAFVHSLAFARAALEQGALPWHKMPTMFALMRLLGFGIRAAYAVHAMLAICVVVAVAATWYRRVPWRLKAAALMTGTLLISPYLFDYDLVWLAFPIAWTTVHALEHGWLRWEREVLAAAWLAPLVAPQIASATAVQAGPLVTAALFVAIVQRASRDGVRIERAAR